MTRHHLEHSLLQTQWDNNLSWSSFPSVTMVIFNTTRRRAILFAFFPIMILYLIYTLKLHLFVPAITTWPSQRQIITELTTLVRHKLWPWTTEADQLEEYYKELEYQQEKAARVPFSRHIVAVGDLHGDLPNARRVLKFSNVIDDSGDWSGEVDFLVQTGDIIDR